MNTMMIPLSMILIYYKYIYYNNIVLINTNK